MPALPPTRLEFARLAIRAAVGFARDAVAQQSAGRHAGAVIACQHAWERIGKSALTIEAPLFAFPPTRAAGPQWMRDHRVMAHVDLLCTRFVIPPRSRLRRNLQNLERWLPPGPFLANPPLNSEYIFDGGAVWKLPVDHFRGTHARAATAAVVRALQVVKLAFPAELKGLSLKV